MSLYRKRPPHHPPVQVGNRANIIFVTVCTRNRRPLLARDQILSLLSGLWKEHQEWKVGRFVLMPDHLHFLCAPGFFEPSDLKAWIRFWKSRASLAWPYPEDKPVWLRDFWDTQMRNGAQYSEKWHYIRNNPVTAGLVADADAWPFQGEIHPLEWHD